MLYGWRANIFIFDTIYSVYLFRIGVSLVRKCVRLRRPIWFVNLNVYISPIVARYANICGESFSVYRWINGALTNFRSIVGWGALLHDLASKGLYDFRHSDRKRLSSLMGFLFYRKRLPGTLFLPSIKDCESVSDEFASANVPTIGIVDSNMLSWMVTIPIPGNDDSFQCINFYCFLFSKLIMSNKIFFLLKWNIGLKIKEVKSKKRKLYLFYLFNKYKYNFNAFEDNVDSIFKVFKNKDIFWKRTLTEYESLLRNFVKNDIIFRWKGF